MKAIFKISAISLVAVLCFSMGSYGQVPVDSVAVKAASEQEAPAKKNKKKLTKEEKQRIKDLNSVVKTAKYKYTKEEKKQIDRLTILEQYLNDWLEDQHTEWFNYGVVQLIINSDKSQAGSSGSSSRDYDMGGELAELYIKNKKHKIEIRVFYRGIEYECERHNTTLSTGDFFKWRLNDITLTEWLFNIPEDIELILYQGQEHPTYKHYNPWEYLIELDRQAGKLSKEDLAKERKHQKESKKKLEKSKRNK